MVAKGEELYITTVVKSQAAAYQQFEQVDSPWW
jgi:hypothetical protein